MATQVKHLSPALLNSIAEHLKERLTGTSPQDLFRVNQWTVLPDQNGDPWFRMFADLMLDDGDHGTTIGFIKVVIEVSMWSNTQTEVYLDLFNGMDRITNDYEALAVELGHEVKEQLTRVFSDHSQPQRAQYNCNTDVL